MERGGDSPVTQDSPERRGGSPDLSGLPPPGKKGRLELNGSPTGPRPRHNGAPPRPLGGERRVRLLCEQSGELDTHAYANTRLKNILARIQRADREGPFPHVCFLSFSFIRGSAFAPVHPFPLQRSKGAQPGLTATAAERSWMLSLILEPAEGTRAGSARLIYKPGGNRIMRARRIKQIAPYKQDLFNSLWFIDSCIRCGSCVVFMCVCVQKQAEIISTLFDGTMYLLCPCFNTRFT